MDDVSIVFIILAVCTLAGAIYLVVSRNLVYSIVALAVVSLGVAGIYAMLGALFLALVHVLIYAGTVCIMVVLSVMVTAQGGMGRTSLFNRNLVCGGLAVLLLLAGTYQILTSFSRPAVQAAAPPGSAGEMGAVIFSDYVIAFEMVGLLLLVALVGAVFLTRE